MELRYKHAKRRIIGEDKRPTNINVDTNITKPMVCICEFWCYLEGSNNSVAISNKGSVRVVIPSEVNTISSILRNGKKCVKIRYRTGESVEIFMDGVKNHPRYEFNKEVSKPIEKLISKFIEVKQVSCDYCSNKID